MTLPDSSSASGLLKTASCCFSTRRECSRCSTRRASSSADEVESSRVAEEIRGWIHADAMCQERHAREGGGVRVGGVVGSHWKVDGRKYGGFFFFLNFFAKSSADPVLPVH